MNTQNRVARKVAVCDNKPVTVGSYNINNISAYASIELNLDVLNEKFAGKTEAVLQEIIDKDVCRLLQQRLIHKAIFYCVHGKEYVTIHTG